MDRERLKEVEQEMIQRELEATEQQLQVSNMVDDFISNRSAIPRTKAHLVTEQLHVCKKPTELLNTE